MTLTAWAAKRPASFSLPTATAALAGAIGTACIVLNGLATQSVSYDEGVSVAMATAKWSSFLGTVSTAEVNMSLYYLLLQLLPFTDPGIAALRALSAAALILAVPLMAILGAQLRSRLSGWIAAALLATNALVVSSAQTARSYALLLALSLGSTVLLLRAVRALGRHRSAWFAAWGVLCGITAYVHLISVVTTVAQVIGCALAWPARVRLLRIGVVTCLLCWVPLAVLALRQGDASISWIPYPSPADLRSVAARVAGGTGPLIVLAAAIVWMAASRRAAHEPEVRFLLALTAIPILGVYLVSVLGPVSLLLPRYLIASAPAAALLVGNAISRSPRPALLAALTMAAVALNARELPARHRGSTEDFRAAATLVRTRACTGDVSAFIDPTAAAAFLLAAGDAGPPSIFPAIRPGASLYDGRRGLGRIGEEIPNAVRAAADRQRVWVVETHTGTAWAADLEARFLRGLQQDEFTRQASWSLPGVRVVLYARGAGGT